MPFVSSKLLLDAFKNIREPASIKEVFEYFYYGHPELSSHIAAALDAGVRYGYIKKIDESHYMLTDHAVHSINNDLSLSEHFRSRYLYYNVKKDDQKQAVEIKPSSTSAKQSSIESRGDERELVSSKRCKRKNLTLDPNRIRRSRDRCRSRTGNISETHPRDK